MSHDALDPETDHGFGESSLYAAHLDRGWHLFDSGDTGGARNSGERAHALVPEDPDAPLLLAAIAQAEGKIEESLRWYETAIDIDPEYPEPYISSAQTLLYELEQYERAIDKLESAQQLDDLVPLERIEVDLLRAECEFQAERPADALESLERLSLVETMTQLVGESSPLPIADLLQPSTPKKRAKLQKSALANLAAMEGHDVDEQELYALSRRLCFQYYRLGRLLCDLQRIQEATDLIAYAIALFPEEADLWYLRGDCQYRLGDTQAAVESSFRVLELDQQKEMPSWAHSDKEMEATVRALLKKLADLGQLPEAIDAQSLRIVVLQRPSFELIYEGMDPRSGLIVLSPPSRCPEQKPVSTLVVYRANLCRFAHNEPQMQRDLWDLLQEELHSHALRLQEMAAMELEFNGPAPRAQRSRTTSAAKSSSGTKAKTSPKSKSSAAGKNKTTPKAKKSKAATPKSKTTASPKSSARVPAKKSSRVRKKNK